MKDTLKTCLSFCSHSLFYLAITSCSVGILLTTLHIVGIVKNFDMLLTYYTVASFSIWPLTIPLFFLKRVKNSR